MATEWNIRARGHACQECQKPFSDGEMCASTLHLAPSTEGVLRPERSDFCQACWDSAESEAKIISLWHSPYSAPEPPAPDPTPRQTVESLLRSLIESVNSEAHQAEIYVLAVMLERKRLLIERSVTQEENGLLRVYEHRHTGEVMLVQDPGLQLDQLEPVQMRIVALLEAPPESPLEAQMLDPGASGAATPD